MIKLKNILLEFDFNDDAELKRGKLIYNGLIKRGFGHLGSISLLGNIAHESGCDPSQGEIGGTGAYGLCQWDPGYGRLDALKAFAKHTKQPIDDLSMQLDFMKCELQNGYYWNNSPVPGIPKQLVFYKHKKNNKTYFKGKSNEYVKKYNKSITSDIKSSTKNLMDNVFSPIKGSLTKRINNSIKFEKYLNGELDDINQDNSDTYIVKSGDTYIVKSGDTLSSIAAKQPKGITIDTIAKANNIDLSNPVIQPGQKLKIK